VKTTNIDAWIDGLPAYLDATDRWRTLAAAVRADMRADDQAEIETLKSELKQTKQELSEAKRNASAGSTYGDLRTTINRLRDELYQLDCALRPAKGESLVEAAKRHVERAQQAQAREWNMDMLGQELGIGGDDIAESIKAEMLELREARRRHEKEIEAAEKSRDHAIAEANALRADSDRYRALRKRTEGRCLDCAGRGAIVRSLAQEDSELCPVCMGTGREERGPVATTTSEEILESMRETAEMARMARAVYFDVRGIEDWDEVWRRIRDRIREQQ
jgi:hypothetical protein